MNRMNYKPGHMTKLKWLGGLLGLLLASAVSAAAQQKPDAAGEINSNPNCGGNDLCVEWRLEDNLARDEYRSDFFYVIVLKTTAKCAATENERLKFQALFPRNKVFLEEAACGDNAEKRNFYSGIGDSRHSFIAVYAGKTKTEAQKFLQTVKATRKFPGANLRRTQVVVVGT